MLIHSNLIDIHQNRIYPAEIVISKGRIKSVRESDKLCENFILPGLIDAHVHIESSMVRPVAFSKIAVKHGTVSVVSDPHEIANVLGVEGISFMVKDAKRTPLKILFGAPSCVPATTFESSGAEITSEMIAEILNWPEIGYLSEMMNYPGVIFQDEEVMKKLQLAKERGVPIDGHAPGLTGIALKQYAEAGISTDHECFTYEEALEKISHGMKILIREGSGAKNFEALIPLLKSHPEMIMFCSDDLHPDDLMKGHINLLVKRAIQSGYNLFDSIRAAGFNTARHYGLDAGMLKENDPADFIIIDSLDNWNIISTYINGIPVFDNGEVHILDSEGETPNKFNINKLNVKDIYVPALGNKMRVIQAIDGELITRAVTQKVLIENGMAVCDIEQDLLKIVVVNRYAQAIPAIGFIQGFKLKKGALATSIGHDSHNIICVGTSDNDILEVVNWIIEHKGGIAAFDGKQIHGLPLEIAGIMTSGSVEFAAKK
ncbi:MAG: adenine deaminase, partial [Bacteroidales bacterium]